MSKEIGRRNELIAEYFCKGLREGKIELIKDLEEWLEKQKERQEEKRE